MKTTRLTHTLATASVFASSLLIAQSGAESESLFDSVAEELRTGGSVFVYMDMEGVVDTVGDWTTTFYQKLSASDPAQYPPIPIDFKSQLRTLGLGQLKAYGLSYGQGEDGIYENRSLLLTEGEPSGLLSIYGSENTSFDIVDIAPADSDLVFDMQLDIGAVETTVRDIAASIMGPMGPGLIDATLMNPMTPSGLTGKDIIAALSTRFSGFVDFGNLEAVENGMENLQELNASAYIKIVGAANTLEAIAGLVGAEITPSDEPGIAQVVTLDMLEMMLGKPFYLFSADAGNLIFAESLAEPKSSTTSVSGLDSFKKLAEGLPEEGSMFVYYSEKLEQAQAIQAKMMASGSDNPVIQELFRLVDTQSGSGAAVVEIRDDGIYSVSRATNSLGQQLVVTMATAMAPALVSNNAIADMASGKAIENNLRMILAAGNQYMLENGTDTATYQQILDGTYFEPIESVRGETYDDIVVDSGGGILVVITEDGEVISLEY